MSVALWTSIVSWAALGWLALVAILGVVRSIRGWIRAIRFRRRSRVLDEARLNWKRWSPPVTLAILPVGGDDAVIESVNGALRLQLPDAEIIAVVSLERQFLIETLTATFDFRRTFRVYRHEIETTRLHAVYASAAYPRLFLVVKRDAGAADALNAAINVAGNPLFAFVPTGTRLDAAGVWRMCDEFMEAPESLAAVTSPVRIDDAGLLATLNEAIRIESSLPMGQGATALAASACAAGAFVVYRRRLLEVVGGFRPDARNPRLDAPLRLVRKLRAWQIPAELRSFPDPVAFEESRGALDLFCRRTSGLVESLGRYGGPLLREGTPAQSRAALWLMLSEVAAPLIELTMAVTFPVAFALHVVPAPVFAAAVALLVGGPLLRSGLATLADCTDRSRHGASWLAARYIGVLLSPLGFRQVALIGRVIAIFRGLRAIRPAPSSTSQPANTFKPGGSHNVQALKADTSLHRVPPAVAPRPPALPLPVVPAPPPADDTVPPPLAWAMVREPRHRRRDAPRTPVAIQSVAPPPAPAQPPTVVPPVPLPANALLPLPVPAPTPPAATPVEVPPKPPVTVTTRPPGRQGGPITFEVTSTYQIKTDAPDGAMPAISLPSAGGGPIIVTTTAGQLALPPTMGSPPAAPPALPAPKPPAEEQQPRRAPRGGRTKRYPRLPPPTPSTERVRRADIPDGETARSEKLRSGQEEPKLEEESDFFLPITDLPEVTDSPLFAPDSTSDHMSSVDPARGAPDLTIDPMIPAPTLRQPVEIRKPQPIEQTPTLPPFPPQRVEGPDRVETRNERPATRKQPTARHPAPPDSDDREPGHEKGDTSAAWPKFDGDESKLADPLDLNELSSAARLDLSEEDMGDTSAALPVVSDPELSDPLDLGTVDTGSTIIPSGEDENSETSAMLPTVEAASEPLDLDLQDLDAIADEIEQVGSSVALEPIEPGDLKRGLEALSQTTLFSGVRPNERNRIMPFLRAAYIKKGRDIIHEGEPGRGLFIIQSGSCEVVQDEGKRVIATLGPGDAFGEMSLLTGNPASATVRAVEETKLYAIAREDFPKLTAELPWLGITLARLIAERISRTSVRVVEELKRGLVGRLELIPPASLVQAINVNNQSGTLGVQAGRNSFTGYFEEGQLLEASTEELTGDAAFYEFLSWRSGSFRFEPVRRSKVARSIQTDTVGLLLEGTRRVDEAKMASGAHASSPALPAVSVPESRTREVIQFDLSDEATALVALSRIPLFSGLRPDQLHEVFEAMQERKAEKGDVVVRQGQLGQALFIVGSGVLDVTSRDEAGVENSLAMLGPGDCFGEIALITGEPTTATVIVLGDGKLLVIPREEFERLLGRVPALGASLARILAARLARASRWVNEQAKQGIVGRLESMPTTELIQALHVNGQTGTLTAQSENKTIEMDFEAGQIIDARAGDLRGDEAFFRFLAWTRGGFKFQPSKAAGAERTVKSDTIGLLFRGIRRIERARESAKQEGRPDIDTSDLSANRSSLLQSTDTGTARERPPSLEPRLAGADTTVESDAVGASITEAPQSAPPAIRFKPLEPDAVEASLKTIGLSPLFFGAPASDRVKILPYLRALDAAPGQVIERLGEKGRALYIVHSGLVEEIDVDEAGGERVIESYEHGEPFGEMSFLGDDPSPTMFRANSAATLLAVVREDFPKLSADLSWLGLTLARFIAQRLMMAGRLLFREQKKGLFGRLDLLPPSAIIQSILVNHQSGVLTARCADSTFNAVFQEGGLLQARTDDREHEDAFYQFLSWGDGTFRFEPGPQTTAERFVKTDTVSLLLEGNRRLDEKKKSSSPSTARVKTDPPTRRATARAEIPDIPGLNSPQATAEALGKLPLFHGLRPDQLIVVVTVMQEVRTGPKDELLAQGTPSEGFFVIADGRFDMMRVEPDKPERKLATLTPGDCFGEESLITGQPSMAAIISRDKGRLLVIPREQFGVLLGKFPALGASLARMLAGRLARVAAVMSGQGAGGLSGVIESMPPAELVQSLNVNQQSGTLSITNEGKTIHVDFLEGQILDARLDDLHGEHAFFMLLAWTKGEFKFTPGRPSPKKTVTLDTMGLLFRGLRQLERARAKRHQEHTQTQRLKMQQDAPPPTAPAQPPPVPPGPPPKRA